MNLDPRAAFFDGLAERWDGFDDPATLAARLTAGLRELGLAPHEAVLDLGCGTGSLTLALLQSIGPAGRVVAVDISAGMLAVARRKIADPRVSWHLAAARALPCPDRCLDRAVCFSVWPHLDARAAVAAELRRVLRPGGHLHVWHLQPRARINQIHAEAGPAVRHDVLPPARETAALLAAQGFEPLAEVDDDQRYLVSARRGGA